MSKLSAIYDQAATDPSYRVRLKSNPKAVLKEAGLEVSPGQTVEVFETRAGEVHLFLGTRSTVPEFDRILVRAGKDDEFKQKLLSNPKCVMEETLGQALPATVKVQVHEATADRMRLILPEASVAEGELSDLDLEAVAGGGLIGNLARRIGNGIRDLLCNDTPVGVSSNSSGASVYMDTSPGIETVKF